MATTQMPIEGVFNRETGQLVGISDEMKEIPVATFDAQNRLVGPSGPVLDVGAAQALASVSPLRFVGHRNKFPAKKNTAAGTLLSGVSRYPVYIGSGNARSIVLSFFNTMLDSAGSSDIANSVTIESVCLERSVPGAFQPVYFSGSRSVVLSAGARDVQSDELSAASFGVPYFERGDLYFVRVRWSVASAGHQWASSRHANEGVTHRSWRFDPAATTITNFDGTGAYTVTGTALLLDSEAKGLCPLVLGRFVDPATKVFLSFGDSILEGTNLGGPTMVQYALENAPSGKWAHGEVTAGSADQLDFSGENRKHFDLFKYANVLVDELGTNNPSASLTTAFPSIYTAARASGILKILRTYLLPRTYSSNGTTSLTSSGTTCTLIPSSGVLPPVGRSVTVVGATPAAYNGTFSVTRSGGGSFDYTAASAPGSTATGTIYWSDLWTTEENQQYVNGGIGGAQETFNAQMETFKTWGLIDATMPLTVVRGVDFYKWRSGVPRLQTDAFTSNFSNGTHPTDAANVELGNEIMPVLDGLKLV